MYAGVGPVTGKRHDLVEVVPPGPRARRQAEAILARFLREIEEKRNPRTTATVEQLLMRYLDRCTCPRFGAHDFKRSRTFVAQASRRSKLRPGNR